VRPVTVIVNTFEVTRTKLLRMSVSPVNCDPRPDSMICHVLRLPGNNILKV
jgi:hypothetical protein